MQFKKITKNDLIDAVYQSTGVGRFIVQDVVESLLDQMKEVMKTGSTIELRGFGTFETRLRKGRENARNPKTGQSLSVAPHYVATFRSGQELKQALWDLPICENSN